LKATQASPDTMERR